MNKRRKTALRHGGGKKDGIRGADSDEGGIEADEVEVTVVREKLETEIIKDDEAEYTEKVRTENTKELEKKVRKGYNFDTTAPGPELRCRRCGQRYRR